MGRPKQLLPWQDTTLLGHAISTAKATSARKTYVVLGANAETIQESVQHPEAEFTVNPKWEEGMGGSISWGIRKAMEGDINWDAVLIMLSDQPLISPDYLNTLLNSITERNSGILATKYPKGVGVPAVFSNNYLLKLRQLSGDQGAKSLIQQNIEDTFALEPGKLHLDIDTPEDYQNLQNL